MRKALALLLVLVAIAVGFVIFSNPFTSSGDGVPEDAGVVVEDGPQAGTYDAPTVVAQRNSEVEKPFDPRGLKVGGGDYGLWGTVVDERGEPVPDAWVAAYSMPFPLMDFEIQPEEILEAPLELSLDPVASTRADSDGRFSLEGLYGRTTYLVARAEKRLTRGRQLVQPEELDGTEGMLLHTVAGAALEGTVRDENGAAVANAEVFVLPSPMYMIQAFRQRDIYLERVYTDGSGHFAIDAVPAGAMLQALAFDGATHPGLREIGPLPKDTTVQTEVALMETGSLSGRIVDDEGEPVGGAKVVAAPLDFRLILPLIRDMSAWIVESRADGSFEFPRLPMRTYMVAAQGRAGRSALYTGLVGGNGSVLGENVVLQTQHRVAGRVVDRKGNAIAGARVALKSIPRKEGANDGGMRGMPDAASIFRELVQNVAPELLPAETWATTGADGRFTLAAWRGAQLEVSAADFGKAEFRLPELDEKQTALLVMVRPGGVRGKVLDPEGKPLRYFLVQAEMDSTAVEPATVQVERHEDEDWSTYGERRDAQREATRQAAFSEHAREGEVPVTPSMPTLENLRNMRFEDDGSGTFELEGLIAGRWRITVRADGYEIGRATGVVVEELEVTEGIEITMSRGCTVRGQVLAAGTREPVAGALVSSGRSQETGMMAMMQMPMDTMALTRSAADGSFELHGVDERHRWIHAMSEGFSPASVEIEQLQDGELREEVIIEVSVGGTIEGRVYDRHGNPMPGRMVGGFSAASRDFWQAPTDLEGRYRAEHVAPGQYFVITAALDDDALFTGDFLSVLGGTRLAQAFVKEGQVVQLDIEDLSAGGCRLSGVVMSGGQPVRNAAMFAMATETSGMFDIRIATARTDANGEFLFKSLAPGEYRMQVVGADWDGSIDFFVDDIPEDYQVLEAPRGLVRGRVLNELTGEAVDGASVLLVRDDQSGGLLAGFMGTDSPTEWKQSDAEGRYEFDGVSPGEYHVEARMDRWAQADEDSLGPTLGRVETRRFDLGENEARDLGDLKMPIAASILVKVSGPDGAFEGGFSLRAMPEDSEAEEIDGWGWNGQGSLTGVTDGKWTVAVQAEGYAAAPLRGVVVHTGEQTEIEVRLERAGMLSLRMLDANGQTPQGAEVRVLDASGTRVDRGGRFAAFAAFAGDGSGAIPLGSYPPGNYTVEVEWQGSVRDRRVSLRAGAQELVEITF